MHVNYQKWLDEELEKNRAQGKKPRLLLHCCCAPCSSYVFEYLCAAFDITAYFYNPNISDEAEYLYRADELKRLICEMPEAKDVKLIVAPYDGATFLELAKDGTFAGGWSPLL